MAKRAFDPAKDRFWRDVLTRFRACGLSVRAFCRQENLKEPLFYAWRRTIAQRDPPTADRANSKRSPKSRRKQPAFLPLVVRGHSLATSTSGIAIELRGGRVLRLAESMPAERLAELVRALEASEAAS